MEQYISGKKKLTNRIYSTLYEAVRQLGKNFASTGDVIEAKNAPDLSKRVWEKYSWTREMRFIRKKALFYF